MAVSLLVLEDTGRRSKRKKRALEWRHGTGFHLCSRIVAPRLENRVKDPNRDFVRSGSCLCFGREGRSGMQHVPCRILQKSADDGQPNVHSSGPEVSGARHWNRRAPKMPGIVPDAEVLARNLFACRFLEESCFRLEAELPGIHGLHRTHYNSLFDCND